MSTYAVGDIQGCLAPLQCLLNEVGFNPDKDRLWVAGDIVNRGPQSLQALRFIKDLGQSAVTVLGNHDLHLLALAYGCNQPGRGDTLDDILRAPDCEELMTWLRHRKIVHYDPILRFTMVHAGIPPQWGLKKALKRAAELEAVLQGKRFRHLLANLYGNEPDGWRKSLEGFARLRVITNYFTRMRFCDASGRLELVSKSSPDQAPAGFAPWYNHPHRKTRKHKVIFGHWAALEGNVKAPNLYALDTGCVWGSRLTLMRLEDETFYSCDCSAFL